MVWRVGLGIALIAAPVTVGAAGMGASLHPRVPEVAVYYVSREYVLTAGDLDSLRREVEALLPSGMLASHGRTLSQLEVSYEFETLDESCRLAAAEISLRVTTTLPLWRPARRVSRQLQKRWDSMLTALARHEAVHAAHARKAAQDFRAALLGLRPAGECRILQRKAAILLQRVMGRYEMKDRRFDARTRNGVSEGVVL